MKWVILVFAVALFLNVIVAHLHIYGLRGGYGKGTWAELSWPMMEARDHARSAWTWFIIFTALDVLLFVYE